MVTELKILQAYTSNLFKVLMGQEKKNELKLYIWDEKKEGLQETAKAL
jgi:hypothetical protein